MRAHTSLELNILFKNCFFYLIWQHQSSFRGIKMCLCCTTLTCTKLRYHLLCKFQFPLLIWAEKEASMLHLKQLGAGFFQLSVKSWIILLSVKLFGLASLCYCSRLSYCTVATDSTLALSNEGHSCYPNSANIGKWKLQHLLGLLQTDIYQFRTCSLARSECCSDSRKTDAIHLLNHHHKEHTQQYIEFFCLAILSALVNSFCTHITTNF